MAVDATLDTFPKLLLRNARVYAARPAFRHKDLGIWQTWTWAQVLRGGARLCGRAQSPRPAPRRHHRHRGFQPAEALLVGDGGADARCHSGPGLCRRRRRRAGLCARPRGHAVCRRAGPGTGRQDPVGAGSGCRSSSRSSTTSRAACATTTTAAFVRSTRSSRAARRRMGDDAAVRAWIDGEIAAGKGSDTSIILYTSGTTGQSKGVVLTGERCIRAASDTVAFDKLDERDVALAYLPLAWVGRSLSQLCAGTGGGLLPGLSGKSRDRHAGPEGDRPDLLLRSAARVRAVAHPRDDPHRGCGLHQAAPVPLFHRGGAAPWRSHSQRPIHLPNGPPALRARQDSGLRAAQERARPLARARRLYGGRGDRSRSVRVLPIARAELEAALWPDGSVPLCHRPSGRSDLLRYGRAGGAQCGHSHRRGRRGAVQVARHVRRLFQGRGQDGRGLDRGRLRKNRRRRLLRRQDRSSEDHRPRQGCRTAQ